MIASHSQCRPVGAADAAMAGRFDDVIRNIGTHRAGTNSFQDDTCCHLGVLKARLAAAALREACSDDMLWLTAGAEGLATLTEDRTGSRAGHTPPPGAQSKGSHR